MSINDEMFALLRASLLSDESVEITDREGVFNEMKAQSVAALPGDWLKQHNVPDKEQWLRYCTVQQGNWLMKMLGQDQLLDLLEQNDIPCVILKGSAAAMAYPNPTLRSMGDVDFLVKRKDFERAASLLEKNGYSLAHEKNDKEHHYSYKKDNTSFELHKRLGVIKESDDKLLSLFETGIDNREFREIEGFRFPVLPADLNGLVLMFHINHHLRSGLGLRQIIDWMMYINILPENIRQEKLFPILRDTGLEKLTLTVTVMCQKYLGLRTIVEDDPELPYEDLMEYIINKGNFGRKAGEKSKIESISLEMSNPVRAFKRLQKGGLLQWKAAKKHKILRPFAWIYQANRISIMLIKKTGLKRFSELRKKGIEQRSLIKSLGLNVERKIKESD